MPSDNKQINIRADDETVALIARLIPAIAKAYGIPIGQSDLFRLGLRELERRFLTPGLIPAPVPIPDPAPAAAPPAAAAPSRKRGRPRKAKGG